MREWTTALPDWRERIKRRQSLVPVGPLFPAEAAAAMGVFGSLQIVDMGTLPDGSHPRFGDVCRPWLLDFAETLFGSYDYENNIRLINEYFLLVSKKNNKSTGAAAIMMTALLRNWRKEAEFLILAPTIEVANNAFDPAEAMVKADRELADLLHVQGHIRTITHRGTGATLKVVAADPATVTGKKATGVLIEELHEFGKIANAEKMIREATGGLASRPEGFVIYISTHSDEAPKGVFEQQLKRYRKIRDGEINAPKSLGVLYEFPEDMIESKAYLEPENWYITNPNLGASVREDFLLDEFEKAQQKSEGSVQIFLAKHLNVPVGVINNSDGWAGAAVWSRGDGGPRSLEELIDRSEAVTCGYDGGGLDDLAGFAAVGRERKTLRWMCWAHALIGPEGMLRRKANATAYETFRAEGSLTLVDRLPEDLDWIVERVKMILEAGVLAQVGADPAGLGSFVDVMGSIGVTQDAGLLIGVRQGIGLMGAAKTVERKLADGTLIHDGSSLMRWCVSNAKMRQTSTGTIMERAASGLGKIDPLMAALAAAQLMSSNPAPMGVRVKSIYSNPDAWDENGFKSTTPEAAEDAGWRGYMDDSMWEGDRWA